VASDRLKKSEKVLLFTVSQLFAILFSLFSLSFRVRRFKKQKYLYILFLDIDLFWKNVDFLRLISGLLINQPNLFKRFIMV
jgi:hypothetical protein